MTAGSRTAKEAIRPKRPRWAAVVAAALVAAALGPGCFTPEQRYRVLSFFFDGVPPPGSEEMIEGLEDGEDERGLRRRVLVEYSLHGPYSKKACKECHSDRFSNTLIVGARELCWTCHEPEDFPGEVVHGPVAAGDCIVCHDAHKSPQPHLLVRAESELCDECHDQSTFARIEQHRAEEGERCTSCHNPHAAGREYMLRSNAGAS